MSANLNIIGTSSAGETFGIREMDASLREAERFLDQYGEAAIHAATFALNGEAENIMADAKVRCPVDEGNLRDTGHVEKPQVSEASIRIKMGFGGPAAPYALRQHEELNYKHTVGEAKYLENAFSAAAVGLGDRVAATMRQELRQ